MTVFLNKFFIDKFFVLYFYISNSATYDFYITIFLNLIAIFYFLFMLYILNLIAFLRNNFFNDLRVLRFIGYSLGLSMKHNPEKFKQVMELLAYYGYIILTAIEVSIKTTFLVIVGYFIAKAPFINLDPSATSSWKFADLFSKSRFYSYRPWAQNSSYLYRGFSSGNFPSEGAWFADDNDVVEAFFPRFLPHSKDFDHEDIFLRPGGVGLRLRTRARVLGKLSVIGTQSMNWTRHLLGSKTDRGAIKKISAPWHRLERNKLYFSRNKALELKLPAHEPFSYYRSEDDCYPVSTKKSFLSRLYIPGFGSKARKVLIYIPSDVVKDNEIFNGREMSATGVGRGANNIIEVQPYERLLIREAKASNTKYDPTADIYKEYRESDFEKVSSTLQNNWLDYVERIKSLSISNPTNYLSARRFSRAYSELNGLITKHGRAVSGYEFPNKESVALDKEELALIKYFRYLTNEPSGTDQVSMNGRYNLFLNRNTPFRNVDVRGEESSLYTYSFDNKFNLIHNLRGRHIYRRSLFDFINIRALEYLRSFSNFFGFSVGTNSSTFNNSSLDSVSHEGLFGFMINDRKKFYKKVFKHGIPDEDNRPLQLRGRESFDLNYATSGSALRYFFDDNSPKVKERIPINSFVDKEDYNRKSEFFFFNKASVDRRKTNTGVYVHKKFKSKDTFEDYKNFYALGSTGFFNQYARAFYQFILDHFTYWLRITFSYMNRNIDIPHFPSPASNTADKFTGLNLYTIFFKTLYFFRKYFRVLLFGPMSNKRVSITKLDYEIDNLELHSMSEISDFTLIALKKTFFSYLTRFISLAVILILNSASVGFNTALNFTINHITAFIFLVLLGVISLFRVRYPYEFDLSKIFYKPKITFVNLMSRFFIKIVRLVKVPFGIVIKSIDVLARFFTTGNMYPSRKPKEGIELYYERLVKDQQTTVNILSFFKVDRIRKLLNRFGFLKSRNKAYFKGYEKSIFKILKESLYKKQFNYIRIPLSENALSLRVQKWLNFLSRPNSPTGQGRLSKFTLKRFKLPYFKVKEKVLYFSFEPTEEFLRIKRFLVTLRSSILWIGGFVRQGWELLMKLLFYSRTRKGKKLKNSLVKVVKFVIRTFSNAVNFVKWKLTEWINKQ